MLGQPLVPMLVRGNDCRRALQGVDGTGKGTAEPLGKRADGTGFILRVGGQALVALVFALKDICFTLKPAAKASDLPVIVAAIRIEAYRPHASPASGAALTPRIGPSKAVAELCPHCDRQVRNLRTPKSETLGKIGVPVHAAAGWPEGGRTQRAVMAMDTFAYHNGRVVSIDPSRIRVEADQRSIVHDPMSQVCDGPLPDSSG